MTKCLCCVAGYHGDCANLIHGSKKLCKCIDPDCPGKDSDKQEKVLAQ